MGDWAMKGNNKEKRAWSRRCMWVQALDETRERGSTVYFVRCLCVR